MPLQIRRGLNAERQDLTPSNGLVEGELLYVTDEKQLYIGTGSVGEHQGLIITGYNNNSAKDAAAEMIADGEHTGITFTYDNETKALSAVVDLSAFDSPIVADALKGSVFADDSTLLVDAIDKKFYGDLNGSIFSDDSSIMIDAIDNKVYAAGGITTSLIESGSIDPITVSSIISFQETVNATNGLVVDNLVVNTRASLQTNLSNDLFLSLSQSHNDVPVSQFVMNRSRGTTDSPLDVNTNDQLGVVSWSGFSGSTYLASSAILGSTTGTITPLKVPGKIEIFTTGDTNGLLVRNALFSTTDGNVINSPTTFSTDEYATSSMVVFSQHHSTSADARNISYLRSRGTEVAPEAVVFNDDIAEIVFQGYDGSDYRAGMVWSIVVDDTIASPIVPMGFVISTNTGSGFQARITISSNGNLTSTAGIFSNSTSGIGYSTGAGGTVTQLTDKSTGVTLDRITGEITLEPTAAIASGGIVNFVLTNSTIAVGDHVLVSHVAGGTLGEYNIVGVAGNGAATIYVKNVSGGLLAEDIVLKFTVIKSVTA